MTMRVAILLTLILTGFAQAADTSATIQMQVASSSSTPLVCRARSAITGRYVTKTYALANLQTTIFQCRRRR